MLSFERPNIESLDEDGLTALALAVAAGQTSAVKLLLECQANSQPLGSEGATPLSYVAVTGSLSICELLLRHRADPYGPSPKDKPIDVKFNPFLQSIQRGKVALCELFLKNGASFSQHWFNTACADGDLSICQLLLKYKADPIGISSFGEHPLIIAPGHGHLSICRLLLEHKADPEQTMEGPSSISNQTNKTNHDEKLYYFNAMQVARHPEIVALLSSVRM